MPSIPFREASRPFRVTDKDIAAFQRGGAVCLRQWLTSAEIALLREGIEANLRNPSPRAKIASRPDDRGRFVEDFCCWQENGYCRRFIFESPIGSVAGQLMQSNTVRLYHDHMLTKELGTRQRTPWHQDQPYYNIEGRMNCSMWIPVDPVDRDSTLELVAGSHTGLTVFEVKKEIPAQIANRSDRRVASQTSCKQTYRQGKYYSKLNFAALIRFFASAIICLIDTQHRRG